MSARHCRRHYPHIMAVKRAIGEMVGDEQWKTAAADRERA